MPVYRRDTVQAVFHGPGVVAPDTVDAAAAAEDELLIRVLRGGICATDLHLLDGEIGEPLSGAIERMSR